VPQPLNRLCGGIEQFWRETRQAGDSDNLFNRSRHGQCGGFVRGLRAETCAQIHNAKIRTRMRRCEHGAPFGNELTVSRYALCSEPVISCKVERRVPTKIARRGRSSQPAGVSVSWRGEYVIPRTPLPRRDAMRAAYFLEGAVPHGYLRRAQT